MVAVEDTSLQIKCTYVRPIQGGGGGGGIGHRGFQSRVTGNTIGSRKIRI